MNREELLSVSHLKKYFPIREGLLSKKTGDVRAVDDISFEIQRGEIFGLVGESGCGKSTAGRTILNLLEPTGGRVVFGGTELYDVENGRKISPKEMKALRKEMQIVFQDPYSSLDARMSIGATMMEGMLKHKLYSKKDAYDRAAELLELCGLPASSMGKYPHEFSGGQRQRIGIARALSLNPSFIVGDELIAALDVSIKAQIISLLQEMIEKFGLTFLFISHDLSVVRYFCDRIGVMYLGSFVEKADSVQLFERPVHPYTKALLSAAPKSSPTEEKTRIILSGEVPTAAAPPSGCKFHTRCPYAKDICRTLVPPEVSIEPGHTVCCHFAKDL